MNKVFGFLIFIIIIISLTPKKVVAQDDPNWIILSQVMFGEERETDFGLKIAPPIFTEQIREKTGEIITLDGFIYPLEGAKASKYFVLSMKPIATCFFCGKAGPETVVEVYAKDKIEYTEELITLKGKFMVNEFSTTGVIYMLDEAEIIDE
ncbi:MAG: hypothetical protein KTR26_08970 [Flammeovirgaceae bacterium]|nr:hypothetical protein [Flammeovirgaceae bacterium]